MDHIRTIPSTAMPRSASAGSPSRPIKTAHRIPTRKTTDAGRPDTHVVTPAAFGNLSKVVMRALNRMPTAAQKTIQYPLGAALSESFDIKIVITRKAPSSAAAPPRQTRNRVRGTDFLSTQEVAEQLNVSRPYVIKLCDSGKLVVNDKTEGGHRRILATSVEAYVAQRKAEMEAARDAYDEASVGLREKEFEGVNLTTPNHTKRYRKY